MTETILTQTRVLRNRDGGTIASARYVWRGPPGDPVFSIENSRDITSTRVDVVVENPCEAIVVIERTKRGAGIIPSTMHGFTRWRVQGNGLAPRGFWFRNTVDENGEHMELHACWFAAVARPIVSEGQQAKHHRITHTTAERYDVAMAADSGFHWQGGTLAVGRLAFDLTRAGDPVKIEAVGVEATGRLLETAGPTTDAQPIVLDSVRYAADQLHEDRGMILLRHAGPLTVVGGSYGDGHQRCPQIELGGIGEQAVTVRGAKFGAFGADTVAPVTWNPGVRPSVLMEGCTYMRAADSLERTSTSTVFP